MKVLQPTAADSLVSISSSDARLGANHLQNVAYPRTIKQAGQESGGELCKIFKL